MLYMKAGKYRKIIQYVVVLYMMLCLTSSISAQEDRGTSIHVPRTSEALKKQLGDEFKIYVKQNYIIATNLDKGVADYVVNGVFDNCRRVLSRQFFNKKSQ